MARRKAVEPELTERQLAALGPRGLKAVGSAEWCWQTVDYFRDSLRYVEIDWDETAGVLDELISAEAWDVIPPDQPYGSLRRMLEAEAPALHGIEAKIRARVPAVAVADSNPYRGACQQLWGDAGGFAVDTFDQLNTRLYGGRLPALPIVIGITAYGKCLGATRYRSLPRITLASNIFWSTRQVVDVLTHEMLHAELMLAGLNPAHAGRDWPRRIEELSPMVLGRPVLAAPVKQRRVREGDGPSKVRAIPQADHLALYEMARWPGSLRPAGYYEAAGGIDVDSY